MAGDLFPLIRHFSRPITRLLIISPLTPNSITLASLIVGLAGISMFVRDGQFFHFVGALLMVISYIFDNCDGELARIKSQQSRFGHHFDTFVDWIVNSGFFLFLGYGAASRFDADVWVWMGAVAAVGGTINYCLSLVREFSDTESQPTDTTAEPQPEHLKEWISYVFREVLRADFCFIVLALALFDLTWVLLPTGAIGAQAYWILQFATSKKFHV